MTLGADEANGSLAVGIDAFSGKKTLLKTSAIEKGTPTGCSLVRSPFFPKFKTGTWVFERFQSSSRVANLQPGDGAFLELQLIFRLCRWHLFLLGNMTALEGGLYGFRSY